MCTSTKFHSYLLNLKRYGRRNTISLFEDNSGGVLLQNFKITVSTELLPLMGVHPTVAHPRAGPRRNVIGRYFCTDIFKIKFNLK